MPTLDEVIEGIATSANADFAFVLTRRGRLVTKTAPRDMPDAGRRRLTKLASTLPRDGKEIAQATLAREQLVPYGGAAPVDVYVVAIDQAVVCVAMASWADKKHVVAAIQAAQSSIERLLAAALKRRGPARRRSTSQSAPPRRGGRATSSPPPRRARSRPPPKAGLVQLAGSNVVASERMQASPSIKQSEEPPEKEGGTGAPNRPGNSSMPDITLGEAPLGRESLAAIEADTPEGWPVDGTGPKIQVGVAPLGRESLAAIDEEERDGVPSGRNLASSPDLRVSLASLPDISETEVRTAHDEQIPRATAADNPARMTLPWVETAADAKRAADAARLGRNVAPRVAVRMQSLAEDELHAILDEETANDATEAMIQEAARQEAARREAKTREDLERDEISGTVRLADDTLVDADEVEPPQSGPVVISLPDKARAPRKSAPPPKHEDIAASDEDDESVALWRDAINRMIDSEKRRSVPPAPKGPPLPSGPPRPSSPSKKSGGKSSAPKARPSSTPSRSKSVPPKKGRSGSSR